MKTSQSMTFWNKSHFSSVLALNRHVNTSGTTSNTRSNKSKYTFSFLIRSVVFNNPYRNVDVYNKSIIWKFSFQKVVLFLRYCWKSGETNVSRQEEYSLIGIHNLRTPTQIPILGNKNCYLFTQPHNFKVKCFSKCFILSNSADKFLLPLILRAITQCMPSL